MTSSEMAILGLIVEQPLYGYQIEQLIEARGMRSWTEIGFSSIYYLLKKLESEGLVAAHSEVVQGKSRRIYQATPAGFAAYREGVRSALSTLEKGSSTVNLGIAGLPVLPAAEAAAALTQYRQQLAEKVTEMQAARAHQEPLPYFASALFERSTAIAQAELDWTDTFIQKLEGLQNGKN